MINGQTAQASRPCWKNQRQWDLIEHFGSGESSAGTAAEVSCALARLAPPLTIGSDAWVRSRACTEDFSSAHKTIAVSGGFTSSPTTSTSLNVSTRCGLKPRSDHTCCTVDFDTPLAAVRCFQVSLDDSMRSGFQALIGALAGRSARDMA